MSQSRWHRGQAGLITRGRDAQRRPCRLDLTALQAAMAWARHTEQAWHQRFDRLDGYLRELQDREPQPDPTPRKPKEKKP